MLSRYESLEHEHNNDDVSVWCISSKKTAHMRVVVGESCRLELAMSATTESAQPSRASDFA